MSENPSRESYKGVRDFYPEDQFIQNYIFEVWRKTAESFGYQEYNASILEYSNLYESKTSDEIVQKQTYTFEDRGGRDVTLRPEMTPTLARMVAAKKRELQLPIRWYSIPNVFRYEKPQRGRLREHWQLNIDAYGVEGEDIEFEIIKLSHTLMRNFGIPQEAFTIKISSRVALNEYLETNLNLDTKSKLQFMQLLDKKEKIDNFEEEAREIAGDDVELNKIKSSKVQSILKKLSEAEINNAVFDPAVVRGFDYYTDLVFEIFDNDPKNNRSLFGGGRYDDLLEIFDEEPLPAIGFGMGDVTIKNTLKTYNLLPEYKSSTDIFICTLEDKHIEYAQVLADNIREKGLNVEVNMSNKSVGDQISMADKKCIPYILCIGDDEITSGEFKIKELQTGEEHLLDEVYIKKIRVSRSNFYTVKES